MSVDFANNPTVSAPHIDGGESFSHAGEYGLQHGHHAVAVPFFHAYISPGGGPVAEQVRGFTLAHGRG